MRIRLLAVPAVVLAITSCAYTPPVRCTQQQLDDEVDPEKCGLEILNGITGSVNLIGAEAAAPTMVLVFDAEFPGPPEGTTGPVDFATINSTEFNGSVESGFNAPFAVTEVPDGDYIIETIMDVDGDFSPLSFTLAGATCGDWLGAHYETAGSSTKGVVAASGGTMTTDVSVIMDHQLTTERPAFQIVEGAGTFDREAATSPTNVQTFKIASTAVHAQYLPEGKDAYPVPDQADYKEEGYPLHLDGPCEPDPDDPKFCLADGPVCDTSFSVWAVDADGDGLLDEHPDYPGFGLKDIWPRVFIVYLGVPERDASGAIVTDENGYPSYTPAVDVPELGLEEGESYFGETFPFGFEATFGAVVPPLGIPTPMRELNVMFPPIVAKEHNQWDDACGDEPTEDLSLPCTEVIDLREETRTADDMPAGIWEINVVSYTGQTWGIPNEISKEGYPSIDESFDATTQGGFLITK